MALRHHSLDDEEISLILSAGGVAKRKPKLISIITSRYRRSLQNSAKALLKDWDDHGVPQEVFNKLQEHQPSIISKYRLREKTSIAGPSHLSTSIVDNTVDVQNNHYYRLYVF